MVKRHEVIGIKQVVRLEWYDYALDVMLTGAPVKEIRGNLDAFIRERLQSGGFGERGEQTYTKAVTQIMKCWVSPYRELVELRDDALSYAKKIDPKIRISLHWAMTVATYPFWFRVATQVGRLLNLQEVITQRQIRQRCFEAMGERSTVERSTRRVIRSFVAWGVLKDSEVKGCYEKSAPVVIVDPELAVLIVEAALWATPETRGSLNNLLNTPAFFPFQLPAMTGDFISSNSERLEVLRYGLDDEFLKLKG